MSERPAILVVEDRALVAAKVGRDLERAGFGVAAVAASVPEAAAMAQSLPLDGAVLDIDLRGRPVYPVAEILRARAVPFLFLTGYGRSALPPEWQTRPLLEKPFGGEVLASALAGALAGAAAEAPPPRPVTPAIRRAWDEIRHARDLVTEQRAWNDEQKGRGG